MSSYQELKKANPAFPILVRECAGVDAKLIARYGKPAAVSILSPETGVAVADTACCLCCRFWAGADGAY